jgi:hypothetical protein
MHQYCKVVTAVIRAAQGRFFNHPRTCEKQINSHTAFGDTRSLCVLLVHQRHLLDVLSLHASDSLGLRRRNVRRCADSDRSEGNIDATIVEWPEDGRERTNTAEETSVLLWLVEDVFSWGSPQ